METTFKNLSVSQKRSRHSSAFSLKTQRLSSLKRFHDSQWKRQHKSLQRKIHQISQRKFPSHNINRGQSETFLRISRSYRRNELIQKTKQNFALLNRLKQSKPTYSMENFLTDRKYQQKLIKNISRFTQEKKNQKPWIPPHIPLNISQTLYKRKVKLLGRSFGLWINGTINGYQVFLKALDSFQQYNLTLSGREMEFKDFKSLVRRLRVSNNKLVLVEV